MKTYEVKHSKKVDVEKSVDRRERSKKTKWKLKMINNENDYMKYDYWKDMMSMKALIFFFFCWHVVMKLREIVKIINNVKSISDKIDF